jgi:hypothetical protein
MPLHSDLSRPLRIAILGAGPIGLEAAIYGRTLGHDVVVFEKGEVAEAVQSYGHVSLFSPWSMNQTSLGRRRLSQAGYPAVAPDACPTGAEFASQYLLPLSRDPLLEGRLRLSSRVVEVGRNGLLKGDLIGQAGRTRHPFRLLIESRTGEHVEHADVVFDCTGTYGCPNAIGDGGISAPGERWLGDRLVRHLPDVAGADRARFAGKRVLVVGGGLSAATAVCALGKLCGEVEHTDVVWAVRKTGLAPYEPIENDPLPGRDRLIREANDLARAGISGKPLRFLHGAFVDFMSAEGHRLRVALRLGNDQMKDELFDEVVGLTGYSPDNSLYRELQVHECYASRGPMKLAASLLSAGVGHGDCLAQPTPGPETLKNPEPNFYILGAKSYGSNSAFLLRIGHAQVRGVYSLLHEDPGLDLYGPAARSEATPWQHAAAPPA